MRVGPPHLLGQGAHLRVDEGGGGRPKVGAASSQGGSAEQGGGQKLAHLIGRWAGERAEGSAMVGRSCGRAAAGGGGGDDDGKRQRAATNGGRQRDWQW